jgi:hypothetical protein
MTETAQFPKGTLFTFEEKHAFIAQMPWEMSRMILWEEVINGSLYH